jgi:hypothetical protein
VIIPTRKPSRAALGRPARLPVRQRQSALPREPNRGLSMKSGGAIDRDVPTRAGTPRPGATTPVNEKRTGEQVAAMIHQDLSRVYGCLSAESR